MRINILLIVFFTLEVSAQVLPNDFYMKETYKVFLREDMETTYYIEKRVNNNLIAVLEEYNKNDGKLINKSESVFINPVKITSYNDYYQIAKNSNYKDGKIFSTNYLVGNSNNCFIKCGVEIFYKNSKVIKKIKYPSCLSLFDINKRILKFDEPYVKNNCIPN